MLSTLPGPPGSRRCPVARADLAGDEHDGDRVHHRVHDRRDQVQAAPGPEVPNETPTLPVALRSPRPRGPAGLVAHEHVVDPRVDEGVVGRQVGAAWRLKTTSTPPLRGTPSRHRQALTVSVPGAGPPPCTAPGNSSSVPQRVQSVSEYGTTLPQDGHARWGSSCCERYRIAASTPMKWIAADDERRQQGAALAGGRSRRRALAKNSRRVAAAAAPNSRTTHTTAMSSAPTATSHARPATTPITALSSSQAARPGRARRARGR